MGVSTATLEQVETALLAVVYANGNITHAARDCGMTRETLTNWVKRTHRDRYLEMRQEIEPKVRAILAAEHEDAALRALEKGKQALDMVDASEVEPKERGKLVQQLAVASGIHSDKAAAYRGRPTEVIEHRHAVEIMTKLRAVNPALVVDGTATEVTDEPDPSDRPRELQHATRNGSPLHREGPDPAGDA